MQPFLLFSLPLMLLDQGGAGREDGWEGQKQSADSGTPLLSDQTRKNRYDATSDERRAYSCHFVSFSPEGSTLIVIITAYLKKMRHSPNAVRNQRGIAESVALRAESRNLLKSWLTRMLYRNNPAAPAIIERHSVSAKAFPSLEIASARVASATDGAAPNNPAKLVGLKRPPTVANAETTSPPIRKRAISSIKGSHPVLLALLGRLVSFCTDTFSECGDFLIAHGFVWASRRITPPRP